MRLFSFREKQRFIYIFGCLINIFSLTIGSSLDVTYLLLNGDNLSSNDLVSIDREALARNIEENIHLSERNILKIQRITIDKVNSNRFIRCIQNATDRTRPLITFQIVHGYQIQQRLESLSSFSIQIKNILYIFRLCSINIHSVSFVGNMTSCRMYHTSTFVSNYTSILITGGFNPSTTTALNTIDKFLIINDTLTMTSGQNMSTARYDHTADVVPSSKLVLIAGGMNSTYMPHVNAELFNSTTGVTSIIPMSIARATHKSAVIPNLNKIVLIGGQNSSYTALTSGDVFDGMQFKSVKNTMMIGRVGHTLTFLPTINKVLIIGGSNNNPDDIQYTNTLEFYDAATNMFQTSTLHMWSKRAGHTATYIPAPINKVLIVGGGSDEINVLDTFDIFDVTTLSFVANGTNKSKRTFHTATLLRNNKAVLLAGGRTSMTDDELAPCEIFNLVTMSSVIVKCLNVPRFFHTASFIPSTGNVLMCGGVDTSKQILNSCEQFQP
ncbi:hypothetical protein I4U23_022814 [Adineta vaga]|nr:hypothetical protein I4U23_022814 [Adineta vaga]